MKKRVNHSAVKHGYVALFTGKVVIGGECRWTGKKYPDGTVIIEITLTTQLPAKKKKR